MKTIYLPGVLFWVCLLALAAFFIGRYFERAEAIQNDVSNLKDRVHQLEARNLRHDVGWGWASRIGSRIPLVKYLFHRD